MSAYAPHIDLSTPCLPWEGAVTRQGYGKTPDGRHAHRVEFENEFGPVPSHLYVGHICHDADLSCAGGDGCRHRLCRNVRHLALLTPSENQRRGVWGRRIVCVNGHPYDDVNTYVRSNGTRDCRSCVRARVARYKQQRRAAAEKAAS